MDKLTFVGVYPGFCPQCADWATDRFPIHTQYVQTTDFASIEFLHDQTDEQIQTARLLNTRYPSAVAALNDSI
jgi:hypothetical protein